MSDDFIKKALGMEVTPYTGDDPKMLVPYEPEPEQQEDPQIETDIAFVRDNLIELMAQNSEAVNELLMIAKQSQHPRAFEVVANLIKTSADLGDSLIKIHKSKQDLQPKQNHTVSPNGAKTVNNNLFVGSTAELQKMLKEMNKPDESGTN